MPEIDWDPDTYLDVMHEGIPGYEELQDAVAATTDELDAHEILELGTGTGETAVRVLARHPDARWTGIDASEAMLARARERVPGAELLVRRLEEPLPPGPFDLVVSALAVHHLDGDGKRDLFARVADALRPGGRFVLGDVVVPRQGEKGQIFIDWEIDLPDTVADQLAWLREAGFDATATDIRADLAVFHAILTR